MKKYMKAEEKKYIGYFILAACMLGVIAVRGFYITRTTGPFIYADELGYWAHAAHMTGNTWAGVMDGVSWYSFGYSFWLALTFLLSDRMLVMYRIAIAINICMGLVMFALAYRIIRRYLPEHDTLVSGLLAFAVTTYPTYVFYSYTTLSETLFALIVWLLFYELVSMEEHAVWWKAVALGATAGYGFMVHNRMLAVLGAVFVCLLALWITHKINWKHILLIAASAGVLFVGYLLMKEYLSLAIVRNEIVESTGGAVSQGSYNTFEFAVNKFLRIFRWTAIKSALLNVMGQIWECLSSSYLLVGLGSAYCVKMVWSRKKTAEPECLYIYPVVSLICSVGMTGIVGYGKLSPQAGTRVRLDVAFSGRYNAPLIPLLIMVACVMLLQSEYKFVLKCYAGTLLVYLAVSAGVFMRLRGVEDGYLNIVSTVAIHIFHWLGEFSVIKCALIALVVSGVFIGLCRMKWKNRLNYCAVFLMMIFLFSTTALYCMRTSIRGENDNTARYTPMFEYLTENTGKGDIVYICQDGKISYDLQTRLVDKAVVCTLPERLTDLEEGAYVVMRKEQMESTDISEYELCLENEEYIVIRM